jgi:DNA-binding transcriptional MerR regulator
VSDRAYLSIGDVLTVLRQEFPDVTISKIRFLESQGLVNPERTPSGYRKFFEPDVERLRWVLRQQREHFLPLKVIKGRLDSEEGPTGENGAYEAPGPGAASGPRGWDAPAGGPDPRAEPAVSAGPSSGRPRTGPAPHAAPAPAGGARPDRMPESAGVRAASGRATPGSPSARQHLPGLAPEPGARTAPDRAVPPPAPGAAPAPARVVPTPQGAGTAAGPATTTVGRVTPPMGAAEPGSREADPAGSEPIDTGAPDDLAGVPPPDTMTVDELAGAVGLTPEAVTELESFGLICGRSVAGSTYYGAEALVVAQMAAGYASYGVEARHLRFLKHAAEREAAFIEQVVLPLLKQRNPEARQRAQDTVADLSRLGMGLRAALLEAALRDQIGG